MDFDVLQRVIVEELQLGVAFKLLLHEIEKAFVFFDGQHFGAALQKVFGQRAEAGADFQDFVAGRDRGGGDDAADLILVMQKILAERLGQFQITFGKNFADVG